MLFNKGEVAGGEWAAALHSVIPQACPEQKVFLALDEALCTGRLTNVSLPWRPMSSGQEAAWEPTESLGTGSRGNLGRKQFTRLEVSEGFAEWGACESEV